MKVIDVCEGFAGFGCLKKYYNSKNIYDFIVISFGLYLSIGDLSKNRIEFYKKIYQEYNLQTSIDLLMNHVCDDIKVRIWSSEKNNDDYLFLLYTCNLLENKTQNISVVFCDQYDEFVFSLNELSYQEIDLVLQYERLLTSVEIQQFSNEWKELVQINSELRVLENGNIHNKKYSDYDEIILEKLRELGMCLRIKLIGCLMASNILGNTSDLAYRIIIEQLISKNKIVIITKGKTDSYDVIECCSS